MTPLANLSPSDIPSLRALSSSDVARNEAEKTYVTATNIHMIPYQGRWFIKNMAEAYADKAAASE